MRAVCLFLTATGLLTAATDPSIVRLQQQIEFVSRATDGVVGASATHIESGRSVSVRGAEAFPMASAFKVPVAVQLMTLVNAGRLTLDKMIALAPQDLHPGSGKISDLMFHPGVALSVENLMELMLVVSDNSAADVMLREAGGGRGGDRAHAGARAARHPRGPLHRGADFRLDRGEESPAGIGMEP